MMLICMKYLCNAAVNHINIHVFTSTKCTLNITRCSCSVGLIFLIKQIPVPHNSQNTLALR